MNIRLYMALPKEQKEYLRKKLQGHSVHIIEETVNDQNIDPDTEILGVFVNSPVPKKILKQLPKLKGIATFSTGYDHIDIKATKKANIPVCSVKSYGEHTVAEYALMLMLAVQRKLYPAVKRVKENTFDWHGLQGSDTENKTIGIIGTGRIGKQMIRLLQGFDADILCTDVFPDLEFAKKHNARYVKLPELIKSSDIISLHAPLLPKTKHLINKRRIKTMKPGVILINTARGGLIDSQALLWGLEQNIIGAAALDVIEGEDLLEDPMGLLNHKHGEQDVKKSLLAKMLIDHPRVLVTPHNAFHSKEALQRILDTSIENILSIARQQPENMV